MAAAPAKLAVFGADSLLGEALLEQLADSVLADVELSVFSDSGDEAASVMYAGRALALKSLTESALEGQDALVVLRAPADPEALRDMLLSQHLPVLDVSASVLSGPYLLAGRGQAGDYRGGLVASAEAVLVASLLECLSPEQRPTQITGSLLMAVSERGRAGVEGLAGETARLLNAQALESTVFPEQIAFNVLPQGAASANSQISELFDGIECQLFAVTVPVFFGHSCAMQWRFESAAEADAAAHALAQERPGIRLLAAGDARGPVSGRDQDGIGLACVERSGSSSLSLWASADNVQTLAAAQVLALVSELLANDVSH